MNVYDVLERLAARVTWTNEEEQREVQQAIDKARSAGIFGTTAERMGTDE